MSSKADLCECSMPIGLAMSLSTSPTSLTAFCAMDDDAQDKVIAEARLVGTRREMEALVRSLAENHRADKQKRKKRT